MRLPDIDYGKAQTMLKYLSGAAKLYVLKDHEKQQLDGQLSRLKRMTGKNVERQLQKLEHDIAETLRHEKRLETEQETHDSYHTKLKRKVDVLDSKLAAYRESKKERETRITQLETKVRLGARDRARHAMFLKLDLAKAQHLANEAKSEGASKEALWKMKKRIEALAERVQKLES